MNNHSVNKLDIAAYISGDLPPAKSGQLEKHLEICSECLAYYTKLKHEKESFLEKHPFDSLHLQDSNEIMRSPMLRRYYALAATITLLITGSIIYLSSINQQNFRIKGNTGISMVVQNLDGNIEKRVDRNKWLK